MPLSILILLVFIASTASIVGVFLALSAPIAISA